MAENNLAEALEKHNKMYDAYLAVFGENSLDRVIYCDPLDTRVEEIDKATKKLAKAIADNTPFKQIDEELWDKVIF